MVFRDSYCGSAGKDWTLFELALSRRRDLVAQVLSPAMNELKNLTGRTRRVRTAVLRACAVSRFCLEQAVRSRPGSRIKGAAFTMNEHRIRIEAKLFRKAYGLTSASFEDPWNIQRALSAGRTSSL